MTTLRRLSFCFLAVFAGLLPLVPASASDTSAEELLRQVSQAYGVLERFHFEATDITVTRSDDLERTSKSHIATAADKSGRFRIASDHPTDGGVVAFDGETTWIYVARLNQYQEINGAMLEGPESPALIRQKDHFVSRYSDVTKRLRRAAFMPPESLRIHGREQECRVVEATYDAPRGLAAEQIVRKYWIATGQPLVYRENSEFQARNPVSGRTTSVAQEIIFQRAEVDGAVPDDAFAPALPEGAKLVAMFDDGGSSPVGRPGVAFDLSDLDGVQHRSSDLTGKVVLLDFWASWCVPCRVELPRVETLHRELSERGVIVFGVNDEPPEKASAFVHERRFTFPTLNDPEGVLFGGYEVRTIPTTVIIGRDGSVSSYLVGAREMSELRRALREAGVE